MASSEVTWSRAPRLSAVPWEPYDTWNEAIRAALLDGQSAGQPVYLDLEPDVLARIATALGIDDQDPVRSLTAAVVPTLHTEPGVGFFSEHIRREWAWRLRGQAGPPPFLAVLAFLSLIAEGMRTDQVFRSSNYYGRLEAALGVAPDPGVQARIHRAFGDESHVLWAALNAWLEDHGGRLGLPTAYAFDYRVHIGVPMSQALVSAGDRIALRDLFTAFRLSPGQSLSRSDMTRLLAHWLPTSAASAALKRLAAQLDALERIADVACIELRAWDGVARETRADGARAGVDLLLAAILRQRPRRRLTLELVARSLASLPTGSYRLQAGIGSHAEAALAAADGQLTLPAADPDGWRALAESPLLSTADLLLASLRLTNGSATLHRVAGRLVVLEQDEERRCYVEVRRVTLGRDNLLLCHESLASKLDQTLATIARPGYARLAPDQLAGLPEGWIVYEPVEILAIAETKDLDLSALVPLSWTEAALGGGLRLPGQSTWLRGAAPEIRAMSLDGGQAVAVLICERVLTGEPPPPVELGSFTEVAVFDLADAALGDGDYRVAIITPSDSGTTLGSTPFRIRSADNPRPALDAELGCDLQSSAWAAVSAAALMPGERAIRGAIIPDDSAPVTPLAEAEIPTLLDASTAAPELADAGADPPAPRAQAGDAPLCLMGSQGHHWQLPPGGREPWRTQWLEGICKHCGGERFFPALPTRKGKWGGRRGQRRSGTPPAPAEPVEAPPIAAKSRADVDQLLDALSYAQAGSWAGYDALASSVDDSPWFPLESARLLSALGHLDLELDRRSARPLRWTIAPATLAVVEGDAILTGYRSASLLEALRQRAAEAGADVDEQQLPGAPSRVVVTADPAGFTAIAREVAEQIGVEIAVQSACAARLAARLPGLEQVAAALPTLERAPGVPAERWQPAFGKWERAEQIDRAGAYRLLTKPVLLAYSSSGHGELRLADSRLLKWLAARAAGHQLLAYDAAARVLSCPLGAQLPGLYERAAVLATGRPPTQRTDGTVTYPEVPPELAAALWTRLAPRSRQP